jgi:hypothetical protein
MEGIDLTEHLVHQRKKILEYNERYLSFIKLLHPNPYVILHLALGDFMGPVPVILAAVVCLSTYSAFPTTWIPSDINASSNVREFPSLGAPEIYNLVDHLWNVFINGSTIVTWSGIVGDEWKSLVYACTDCPERAHKCLLMAAGHTDISLIVLSYGGFQIPLSEACLGAGIAHFDPRCFDPRWYDMLWRKRRYDAVFAHLKTVISAIEYIYRRIFSCSSLIWDVKNSKICVGFPWFCSKTLTLQRWALYPMASPAGCRLSTVDEIMKRNIFNGKDIHFTLNMHLDWMRTVAANLGNMERETASYPQYIRDAMPRSFIFKKPIFGHS